MPRHRDFQVLAPERLRGSRGRQLEWRVSLRTHMKFRDLLHELVDLEGVPQDLEVQARMETLRDEIRALPGYPRGYHPERDVIVPVTTSEMR